MLKLGGTILFGKWGKCPGTSKKEDERDKMAKSVHILQCDPFPLTPSEKASKIIKPHRNLREQQRKSKDTVDVLY